jgi:hypothetical protein
MVSSSVSWPTQFPTPTLTGYSLSPFDVVAVSQMESGAARQRLRYTSVPFNVSVEWPMPSDIFGYFQSWYAHKAQEGSRWVTMKLGNGLGAHQTEARFVGSYTATLASDKLWRVTANLEVREMDVLSEASLDIILGDIGVSIPQIQQMAKVLGDLVNIDLIDAW